ncbi:MAG TPA: hypothetical protein VFG20_08780 [Planctomycetaceae bacterium]|nr:hypothetical protein [Planctomycetaceae bacterium]
MMSFTFLRFMLIAGLVVNVAGVVTAQEPPVQKDAEPQPATAKSSPASEQLTKIAESMRGIETRLKDRETGDATQTAQQSVIDQLDQLLNMPPDQSPPPDGGGGGGSSSQQNNPPPSGQSSGKPKSSAKPKKTPAGDPGQMRPKPAGQTGQKDRTNAQDSEERTGPNRAAGNPASKRQRLEVEVWGHLPEKLREQLLSSYGEKMLPQYEDAVRKFYDELANPSSMRNKPK